jgi:hypothetical protein
MDVFLHPSQRGLLVEQAGIDHATAMDFVRRKKSKGAKSILNHDGNEAVAVDADQRPRVGLAISQTIASAMNPDQHWQWTCSVAWCPDV